MDKLVCSNCERSGTAKDQKSPIFPCDNCRTLLCGECSRLTASEIKCILLQSVPRTLQSKCVQCRGMNCIKLYKQIIQDKELAIKDKIQIIDDKIMIIQTLQDRTKELEKGRTFAEVAGNAKTHASSQIRRRDVPSVIIVPKEAQDADITKNNIQKSLEPKKINVAIKSRNGKVIIKFSTEVGMQRLVAESKERMSNNYDVEVSEVREPKIKIIMEDNSMPVAELEECIRSQNDIICF